MEAYRILTMDGNSDIRRINRAALRRKIKGCLVLESATLQEGRVLVEAEHPDLIILDAEMPDGSGFDFCRELRLRNDTPVLFVTGLDTMPDIQAGFDAGANEYLTKPYSIHMLVYRVETMLRQRAVWESEGINEQRRI